MPQFGMPTVQGEISAFKEALSTARDVVAKSEMNKFAAEQDAADRENAQIALQTFQQRITPAKPKTTRMLGSAMEKEGLPIEETVPVGEPDVPDFIRAGAEASTMLARTGGRHSQAAAKQILEYVDAKVKEKQVTQRTPKVILRDVLDDKGKPFVEPMGRGLVRKLQEQFDVTQGQVVGQVWTVAREVIGSGGGRNKNLDTKFEGYKEKLVKAKEGLQQAENYGTAADLDEAIKHFQALPQWNKLIAAQKSGDTGLQEEILASLGAYKAVTAKMAAEYLEHKRNYPTYRDLFRGYVPPGGARPKEGYKINWETGQQEEGLYEDPEGFAERWGFKRLGKKPAATTATGKGAPSAPPAGGKATGVKFRMPDGRTGTAKSADKVPTGGTIIQ